MMYAKVLKNKVTLKSVLQMHLKMHNVKMFIFKMRVKMVLQPLPAPWWKLDGSCSCSLSGFRSGQPHSDRWPSWCNPSVWSPRRHWETHRKHQGQLSDWLMWLMWMTEKERSAKNIHSETQWLSLRSRNSCFFHLQWWKRLKKIEKEEENTCGECMRIFMSSSWIQNYLF